MFANAQKQAFPIFTALALSQKFSYSWRALSAASAKAMSGSSDLLHNQTSPFKIVALAEEVCG